MARASGARGMVWVVGALSLALLLPAPAVGPAAADHDGEPGHGHGGGGGGGGGGKADPPTAVAVDSHGRVYVGFGSSGDLVRLTRDGKVIKPFKVPADGPVTALSIARYDRVWVDNGRTATLLRRKDGSPVARVSHGPRSCPDKKAGAPHEYGGLDSAGRTVYIANRCEKSVEVFRWGKQTERLARFVPKGAGMPRGVAVWPGPGKAHDRLLVTMPRRGVVLVYDVEKVGDREKPVRTIRLPRPRGGRKPVPSGVVVDRFGRVGVSDRANHALWFLDGPKFRLYRTLGHPPRPSRRGGSLSAPVALAQRRFDRSPLAGTIVVAEQGNLRVQRWNPWGYTFWATKVSAPK